MRDEVDEEEGGFYEDNNATVDIVYGDEQHVVDMEEGGQNLSDGADLYDLNELPSQPIAR